MTNGQKEAIEYMLQYNDYEKDSPEALSFWAAFENVEMRFNSNERFEDFIEDAEGANIKEQMPKFYDDACLIFSVMPPPPQWVASRIADYMLNYIDKWYAEQMKKERDNV